MGNKRGKKIAKKIRKVFGAPKNIRKFSKNIGKKSIKKIV